MRQEFFEELSALNTRIKNGTNPPGDDYVALLLKWKVIKPEEENHMRRHWFPAENELHDLSVPVWWREYQPIEPIIRLGCTAAFEESVRGNLPIESYWIPAGDRIAVTIARSELQITLIRITPPCPVVGQDPPTVTVTSGEGHDIGPTRQIWTVQRNPARWSW
jgi:hypothetical protein